MANKPIKRSEYMAALSRDHHAGLLFGWKIRQGLKKNVQLSRIKNYVGFFWENHLKEHFREEEILLFDRVEDPLCRQAKTEHLRIEEFMQQLNNDESGSEQEYLKFANLLTAHIRFEERELFTRLESILPEAALQEIGRALCEHHVAPFADDYPDTFWS